MNGAHLLDQIVFIKKGEQPPVPVQRRPGREGHQRRIQSKPHFLELTDDPDDICLRVSLVQPGQHRLIDRLDRAGHKQTARIAQCRQVLGMLQQVFDLDGHIVSQLRELRV